MKKIGEILRTMGRALHMELTEHRSSFLVYSVLRIAVIATMVLQFLNRNYENVFLCLLTLLLLVLPGFLQLTFRIELPKVLEIIILVFIFAAEILGEINEFYLKFPYWDTVLHTMNGFLAAAIGFSLVDLLNRNKKVGMSLSPVFVAIVSLCFSMTIGVVWEFFEFAMDQLAGFDMQKDTVIQAIHSVALNAEGHNAVVDITGITETAVNGKVLPIDGYLDVGLFDTMEDLLVNFIGAVVFSVIGYFYIKNRGKGGLIRQLVPTRKTGSQDYIRQVIEEEKVEKAKPLKKRQETKKKQETK